MKNILNTIKHISKAHKLLVISFTIFFLFSVTIRVFATPPTSPYQAGNTLDPTCAPGDTNCYVEILASQTGNSGKFLTTDGTSTSWNTITTTQAIGDAITNATEGSILFAGASGVFAQDNSNFFWDDTNNRLGVGTSSPTRKLDVNGDVRIGDWFYVDRVGGALTSYLGIKIRGASEISNFGNPLGNGAVEIVVSGTAGILMGTQDAKPIVFGTSNTERLRIDSSGYVGIGTTAPSGKLTVSSSGGINSGLNINLTNDGSYGTIDFNTPTSGLLGQFLATGNSFVNGVIGPNQVILANYDNDGAVGLIAGGNSGYINFSTGGYLVSNERMRITTSGNVGIGTSTPGAKLDVNGIITSAGSGSQSERFGLGSVSSGLRSSAFGYNATASGSDALALGWSSTSSGTSSTSVGSQSSASASYSTAVGVGAYATYDNATSLGFQAQALNVNATALGRSSTASSGYGIAIGRGATASGANFSIAIGTESSITHTGSIGFGYGATSTAINQFIVGSENNPISDVYFGKGVTHASPGSFTLNSTSGSGTDIAGGNLTLAGGAGTGSGAGGYLSFSTAPAGSSGSSLNSLSERMRITTSGNVGIGTTTPGQKLDVQGFINANSGFITPVSGGGLYLSAATAGVYTGSNIVTLGNWNDATKGVTVNTSTGNVGIGTTGPSQKLVIQDTGTGIIRMGNMTGATDIGTISFSGDITPANTAISGDSISTYINAPVGPTSFRISNSTKMILLANGNVGIGTSTPDSLLEVSKSNAVAITAKKSGGWTSIDINDSSTNYLRLGVSATPSGFITGAGANDPVIMAGNSTNLWLNAGTATMMLKSNGYVGIGTTSPGYKLDVNGDINFPNTSAIKIDGSNFIKYYPSNFATVVGIGAGADKSYSTAFGYYAGNANTGDQQIVFGSLAGSSNTGGYQTAFGVYAGGGNSGTLQTTMGNTAGYLNTGGYQVAIGNQAGHSNTGIYQISIGSLAGKSNTGARSIGIGTEAINTNTADDVIAIGYQAGKNNSTANQFIIQQANINATPLIQGNFSTGDIGIGTIAPGAKLEINIPNTSNKTGLRIKDFTSNSANLFEIDSASGSGGDVFKVYPNLASQGGFYSYDGYGSNLQFKNRTLSVNNMSSSGLISLKLSYNDTIYGLIGLSDASGDLEISNTWTGYGINIKGTSSSAVYVKNSTSNVGIQNTAPAYTLHAGTSSTSGIVARFENSTGTCDINPTTTSLSCSSDINLKKNITTLDGIDFILNTESNIEYTTNLDKLLALDVVTYNWNTEDDNTTKHIGFIAQQVESIYPDLVTTDINTGLKSLNITNMIPYTIAGIQQINVTLTGIQNLDESSSFVSNLRSWFASASNGIMKLFVKSISTDELCVGSVCVTESQFLQMIQNSNGGYSAPTPPDTEGEIIDGNTDNTEENNEEENIDENADDIEIVENTEDQNDTEESDELENIPETNQEETTE